MSNSVTDKTYALFENHNNQKIVSQIEAAGSKIIRFPALETKTVGLDADSMEKVKNLKTFDWLIFTDVLAVNFFLEILEENEVDFFDLDEIRVCALGEIVSDRLRFAQLHADVIPNMIEPKNVVSILKNYIAENELRNLKFLLLGEISIDSGIKNELIKEGAEVFEMPVYQIKKTSADGIPKLKALLKGGAIDEFIFSSPNDFIALKYIFNNEPLAEVFAEIEISAVDGLMFQIIREHNLKSDGLFHPQNLDKVER